MPRLATVALGLLLFGFLLSLAQAAATPGICPCADPNELVADFAAAFSNFDLERNCTVGEGGVCFPRNYGATSCQRWDATLYDACRKSNSPLPSWCSHEWCFVDPDNCGLPHDPSVLYPGLFYSYQTCGYLNSYSDDVLINNLKNRTLRISYPGDSNSGFTIITDPITGEKKGSFPTFMNRIFDQLDLSVEIHNVSVWSQERFPQSSYTACVHEVALGLTDLCVGNFWVTKERTLMSQFTTELYQDLFYLVTAKEDTRSFSDFIKKPFEPFTPGVWALIIATLVVMSAAYVIVEGWTNEAEFPEKTVRGKFWISVYYSVVSFVGASPVHTPETLPGRALSMGFGFFVLVTLASYTATLASFLVTDSFVGEIDTINEGVRAGKKFCGMAAIQSNLFAQYPQLTPLYTGMARAQDALDLMDDGGCDVAIINELNWDFSQRGMGLESNEDRHCDKIRVGDVVLSIGIAMPVSPELHREVSYAVVKFDSERPYALDDSDARNSFLDPYVCDDNEIVSADDTAFGVYDMGGTVFLTVLVIIVSLGWFFVSSQKSRPREPLPSRRQSQLRHSNLHPRRSTILTAPMPAAEVDLSIKSLEEVADLVVSRLRSQEMRFDDSKPPSTTVGTCHDSSSDGQD